MVEEDLLGLRKTFYGINTGFGILCDKVINADQLETLQHNLIRSHSCGTGMSADQRVVRWMILLKIISLAKGHSGQVWANRVLIMLLNENILPEVPEQGSPRASGDLAPLSHCSLLCIYMVRVSCTTMVFGTSADFFRNHQTVLPGLKEKKVLHLSTEPNLASGPIDQLYNWSWKVTANRNNLRLCFLRSINGNMDAFWWTDPFIEKPGWTDLGSKPYFAAFWQEWDFHKKQEFSSGSLFVQMYTSSDRSEQGRCGLCEISCRKGDQRRHRQPLILKMEMFLSGGNFHAQSLALATDFLKIAPQKLEILQSAGCTRSSLVSEAYLIFWRKNQSQFRLYDHSVFCSFIG